MGKADWDTGYFQAEVYKKALEKMGYKVTGPLLSSGVLCCGSSRRYGSLGEWMVWKSRLLCKEAMGKVKPVGYVAKSGGLQGYLIDKKTADKFNIKSVMDIKNHAKEFDSNGDGKADMVACHPG